MVKKDIQQPSPVIVEVQHATDCYIVSHEVQLYSGMDIVVMSGDVFCCSKVCDTLVGVLYYLVCVTDYIRDQLTFVIFSV